MKFDEDNYPQDSTDHPTSILYELTSCPYASSSSYLDEVNVVPRIPDGKVQEPVQPTSTASDTPVTENVVDDSQNEGAEVISQVVATSSKFSKLAHSS